MCNDETNNIDCNFDGGDCCSNCTNTDNCSDCVCHAESPIVNCGKYHFIQSIAKLLSSIILDVRREKQFFKTNHFSKIFDFLKDMGN